MATVTDPAHTRRRPLTTDEIDAALLDPTVFIDQHCWIRGPGGRTERFRLWPYQQETLEAMDDESRLLVLKARQLGISWCGDGYALWLCSANRGQTVLIISQGLRESQEEMRRVRFMHARLPPELRRRIGGEVPGERAPDTTQRIEFPDMDSRIISLPSTEHAGTSFTATLVIIHELAKIKNATSLMAGVTPTMADEGRMFVISTAKGYSGVFAQTWKRTQARWHAGQVVGDRGAPGEFRPVFIPWHARPGRDRAWYDATSRTLTGQEMRQEYPETPEEAFRGSSDAVFAEEFDRGTVAVNGTRHEDSTWPVYGGVDPGVNHGVGYLMETYGDHVFVFAERHLQNATVDALGVALADEAAEFGLAPAEVITYVDAFDVGRNEHTLKTDRDVLAQHGLSVDFDGERFYPAERVKLIKLLLKQRRLFISEDCPDLLDALEFAEWKTRRAATGEMVREDTYAKDGVHEHPLDALGTALVKLFPVQAPAAVDTTLSLAHARQYAYSGSEFG